MSRFVNLSENIIKIRKIAGMNQEELGNVLHLSRQAISKWERGLSIPNIYEIVQMSDYFGVTLNDIIYGDVCEEGK